MKKILLALLVIPLVLAGCSSTPEEGQTPAPVEDRAGKPQTLPPTDVKPITPTVIPGTDDWLKDPRLKNPASPLSKRSIYFDFDSDAIKAEYVPLVEAHAAFLRQYPKASMLIQGNADERGSREYNLALGQRRADAVKRRLVLLGAQDAQIESVSLGEEKPVCTDRTEECYAKNRRGDILYRGE